MQRPLIGITLDHCNDSSYSKYCDWYALRTNYCKVISLYGGIPLLLPYDLKSIDEYCALCHGFVIPGGDYDIAPEHYGQPVEPGLRTLKTERTAFESQLLEHIISLQKPFLAICAGMQLLNVIRGGTLLQDLGERNALHEQADPDRHTAHAMAIAPDSTLATLTDTTSTEVNSTHHQAVDRLGTDLRIAGTAPDGVIEAIELCDHPFGLGLEWHPEYELTELDRAIWPEFIRRAAQLIV